MASHGGTAETMVANAAVAARLLDIPFDPSFRGEVMQACDVVNPSSPREKYRQACGVMGNGAEGSQPMPTSNHNSDSDGDEEEVRKNKRDMLIERLERALHDVQTSTFQGARTDLDASLEIVKLRRLRSFWHYYNEFNDYDSELNEFDDEALSLIGNYVELQDDADSICDYGDPDSDKICRLLEHLGEQEVCMTRDVLGAVREREDAQTLGAEVLGNFYGEDYW